MSYEYPTTPVPAFPYDIKASWKNTISEFDSGDEQRRQKNLYAKYDVVLTYPALSATNIQLLWNFYQARRGTYEAFYFYTLEEQTWNNNYVGIGDGTTVLWDLPGKSTSSQTIYVNGAAVNAALYTIGTGTGDASSDTVTFATAPPENDLITCDFHGYLRIRCRFQEELTRTSFVGALYKTGIKLKGLANA